MLLSTLVIDYKQLTQVRRTRVLLPIKLRNITTHHQQKQYQKHPNSFVTRRSFFGGEQGYGSAKVRSLNLTLLRYRPSSKKNKKERLVARYNSKKLSNISCFGKCRLPSPKLTICFLLSRLKSELCSKNLLISISVNKKCV